MMTAAPTASNNYGTGSLSINFFISVNLEEFKVLPLTPIILHYELKPHQFHGPRTQIKTSSSNSYLTVSHESIRIISGYGFDMDASIGCIYDESLYL